MHRVPCTMHACHSSHCAIQLHSLLTCVAAAYLCLRLCRQLMSAKLSGRILKVARDQQEEIDAEDLEAEHEARGQVQVSCGSGVWTQEVRWRLVCWAWCCVVETRDAGS